MRSKRACVIGRRLSIELVRLVSLAAEGLSEIATSPQPNGPTAGTDNKQAPPNTWHNYRDPLTIRPRCLRTAPEPSDVGSEPAARKPGLSFGAQSVTADRLVVSFTGRGPASKSSRCTV